MTTQRQDPSPESNHFDESVGLDDPKPFTNWQPSPDQIREWSQRILDELTPVERQRRLRCDLRPNVRCADGRLVDVDADDYQRHANRNTTHAEVT